MDPPIPQPSCFKVLVSVYGLNMHHTSCFFEPVTSISTNFFYLDRIFLFFFKCSSISFIPHSLQIHRLYELVSYLKEVCYDLIILIFYGEELPWQVQVTNLTCPATPAFVCVE